MPPEARGLRRDAVRMLVATRHDGRLRHARFDDLPRLLEPGDLVVINTSATLPAALPAIGARRRAGGGAPVDRAARRPVEPRAAPGWWPPAVGGGRPAHRPPRGRARRAPAPAGPPPRRRAPVGGGAVAARAPALLPGRPRPSHPLRVRAPELAVVGLSERLRPRAGLGRDAERREAVHPGDRDPAGRLRRGRRPDRPPHRRGLTRGRRSHRIPSGTGSPPLPPGWST